MHFVLEREPVVKWPVKVRVPRDGGSYAEQQFTAHFRILPQSQVDSFDPRHIDREMLDQALVGWGEDVRDEGGESVPFLPETKAAVLDIPYVRLALMRAYGEAVAGRREKN